MGVVSRMKGKSLNDAKATGGYVYFAPKPDGSKATYRVRIEKVLVVDKRGGGDLFAVETTILETELPNYKVGSRCSYSIKMELDAAPGNIKSFLAAATGLDPNDEAALAENDWDAISEEAITDEQPLKGNELYIDAVNREGKTAKKDKEGNLYLPSYTLCTFRPV